jgi:hypothetical protein
MFVFSLIAAASVMFALLLIAPMFVTVRGIVILCSRVTTSASTRLRSWLRHYATSRKAWGSNTDVN